MKVKGCTKSVQVAQTSWMSFANGVKVSNRTAASEIYSEYIYLSADGSKVRVSLCILLKEN